MFKNVFRRCNGLTFNMPSININQCPQFFAFLDQFRTPHISSMPLHPKATVPKPSNWLKQSGLWLVLGEVSG